MSRGCWLSEFPALLFGVENIASSESTTERVMERWEDSIDDNLEARGSSDFHTLTADSWPCRRRASFADSEAENTGSVPKTSNGLTLAQVPWQSHCSRANKRYRAETFGWRAIGEPPTADPWKEQAVKKSPPTLRMCCDLGRDSWIDNASPLGGGWKLPWAVPPPSPASNPPPPGKPGIGQSHS